MKPTLPQPLRVIVCRVGRLPAVEILPVNRHGSALDAMQAIVGGYLECIPYDDGIDIWCNEDADRLQLPLNRVFPTVGKANPPGFEDAFVIDMTDGGRPEPGAPAEWRIRGDFFLARHDDYGEMVSATDADVEKYGRRFDAEDVRAAQAMNATRSRS